MKFLFFLSCSIFLIVSTSALDSTNVACIQTCKNLGCLSGINLPLSLRNQFLNHPAGCACVICNNYVQCNNNQDADNYCLGILGCKGRDCDWGMVECLDCPATPTVKFQRKAVDDKNARCNMACMNRGCNAGFINNFGTGYLKCTCTICQGTTPCTSGVAMANYCRSIGCNPTLNDPTFPNNNSPDGNNNANTNCDFGISTCFDCPYA